MVNVKLENPTLDSFGNSTGLLGHYGSGAMLARDGRTMEEPDEYGQEWQVLLNEPKLFQTNRAPQHPAKCIPPSRASTVRRLGESITRSAAERACAHVMELFEQCVYDVMATGDLEMAGVVGSF